MESGKTTQLQALALYQIASDPRCSWIKQIRVGGQKYKHAYKINTNTALILKYSTKRKKTKYREFQFTFHKVERDKVKAIGSRVKNVILALICVKAKAICCLTKGEFWRLIRSRKLAIGAEETQIQLLVTASKRHHFRVYVGGGEKGMVAEKSPILVPRNGFPNRLFN
jgi:hypothetical protein